VQQRSNIYLSLSHLPLVYVGRLQDIEWIVIYLSATYTVLNEIAVNSSSATTVRNGPLLYVYAIKKEGIKISSTEYIFLK
jgi:hypothetical protein